MSDRARRLKDLAQKTITLPESGVEVTIRKLDPFELAERDGKSILNVDSDDFSTAREILQICMVDPNLWLGPEEECPDDAVTVRHLGWDLRVLTRAVFDFNGLSQETANAAASFRATERGDSGPDRSEVPSSSNGADAPSPDGAVVPTGDLSESRGT